MDKMKKQLECLSLEISNNISDIFDLEERIRQDKADIRTMKRDNRIMNRQLKKLIRAMEKNNEA